MNPWGGEEEEEEGAGDSQHAFGVEVIMRHWSESYRWHDETHRVCLCSSLSHCWLPPSFSLSCDCCFVSSFAIFAPPPPPSLSPHLSYCLPPFFYILLPPPVGLSFLFYCFAFLQNSRAKFLLTAWSDVHTMLSSFSGSSHGRNPPPKHFWRCERRSVIFSHKKRWWKGVAKNRNKNRWMCKWIVRGGVERL